MIATDRVSRARARLVLDYPWWGSLSMRLHLAADPSVETFSTDGTSLLYSPEFAASLTDAELTGVLAHEVSHCALLHPYRTGGRDLSEWNEACDYVVNSMLVKEGFTLPSGCLVDSQYDGMGAEQVYAVRHGRRRKEEQGQGQQGQQGQQPQQGQGQASPTGDFTRAPEPTQGQQDGQGQQTQQQGQAGQPMSATDWMVAAEQTSAVCARAGHLPGDMAREARQTHESRTDWREVLRRFVEQTVATDYSWLRPNRRFAADGLYLPGMVKENTPRLAIAIDTSGSISQDMLNTFAAELTAILHETRPESLDVLYCDTDVRHAETFSPDDAEVKLACHGGGGTRFQPVFDRIAESDQDAPACLIYFTDLYGSAPAEPEYPVLWVVPEWSMETGWFGETVRLPV